MTPFDKHTVAIVALISACAALAGFLFVGSLLDLPGGSLDPMEALLQLPAWLAGGGVMRANALAPLAGMLAACAIWGIWVHQALRGGTFRLGEEHGSSRWGSIEEGKAFMNQDEPDLNIPLTSSIGIPVSRSDFDLETDRNRNICVVGTPGTGKTRSHVLPLLMQMNASYLVTDPKGTLIESTGWMFEAAGYRIRNFDLVRMETSSHYNPLAYVRTDVDVLAIVECLITNTTGDAEHTGDPFWENAEKMLYTALIALLRDWFPAKDYNMSSLLTLLSLAEARENDENFKSALDLMFLQIEEGKKYKQNDGSSPDAAGNAGLSRSFGTKQADNGWSWVPSKFKRNSDGVKPADCGGLSADEDFHILGACAPDLAGVQQDPRAGHFRGLLHVDGDFVGVCVRRALPIGEAVAVVDVAAVIDLGLAVLADVLPESDVLAVVDGFGLRDRPLGMLLKACLVGDGH